MASNVLDRHLEARADDVALIDRTKQGNTRITYRELYWNSSRLARWLKKQGVSPGDRMAIYGEASIESYTVLLALYRIGAMATLIPETPSDSLLQERLTSCEVRWASVCGERPLHQLRRITQAAILSLNLLVVGNEPFANEFSYQEALAEADGLIDPASVEANALQLMIYGDDGRPYVYAGLGNLIALSYQLHSLLELGETDRVGLTIQNGGLLHPLLMTANLMVSGSTVVWVDKEWSTAVKEHGLTKLVTGIGSLRHTDESVNRLAEILVLGPERLVHEVSSERAMWIRATIDMAEGMLIPEDAECRWPTGGPSADRSDPEPLRYRVEPLTDIHELASVVSQLADVREVACLVAPNGSMELWIVSERGELSLRQELNERWPQMANDLEQVRLTVVPELPETHEGAVATHILLSIMAGESHVAVGSVRNFEVLENLVRCRWAEPS